MPDEQTATPATPAPSTPADTGTPPSTPVASPGGSAPAVPSGASSPEGGTTLGEGGGKSDNQAPPQVFPSNWFELLANGDKDLEKRISRYKDPTSFARSWAEAQKRISAGDLASPRPDGKDEKALTDWRVSRGLPEKPEGYLEKVPDGLVVGEQDKPLVDNFLKDMHASDVPPATVHKALQWYYNSQEQMAVARSEADKLHRQEAEDHLRTEWGESYRGNLNAINSVFKTMAPEGLLERFYSARLADGTPLGDDPDTLKFLATVANEMNPRGIVTPATGQSISASIQSELAQLREEMKDARGRQPGGYWTSPAKQERYRELVDAEQRAKARAA